MAESICRTLRDGALDGEQAPALTIKDSIVSPFGFDVFAHMLTQLSSNILAGKSQSRGLVLVAFSRAPSFYVELLKRRGTDAASSNNWFRIVDCYTDPLGWNDWLVEHGNILGLLHEASTAATLCKDVRNLDKLFSSIIELGIELAGQGKDRFSVAIDSVNEMLRHSSISAVAGLLSNLRSHERLSSAFWLLHSDIHENKATAVLEYISSMVANLEPSNQLAGGLNGDPEHISFLQQDSKKGKFHVRFKRRNGRVRVSCEEFHVEQSGIKFTSVPFEDGVINQGLVPKVQFNLDLSEKELIDRAKVVLPFEHQGNGKPIQIYDGRRSLSENNDTTIASTKQLHTNENSNKGEIIYFRDSDDEMPDSDEDPDDDLDI